jgi:DNA-binding IclR family transcriptional regulator
MWEERGTPPASGITAKSFRMKKRRFAMRYTARLAGPVTTARPAVGALADRRAMVRSMTAKSKTSGEDVRGSIQVIDRMMSLLEVLARASGAVPLKTLAAATGLHPSTAHRILASMTENRFVERQDGGSYRLGIRLLELGNLVKTRINLREVALPYMQALHEDIGEAINLAVRRDDDLVYIERTSSGRSLVRVVYLVGDRAPLHLTSVGKLFLADGDAESLRQYARRTGLPGKTPHSLTSLPALERDLERVRRHQLAYDNEEAEVGLKCVAAPIRDDEGQLVAGLSVSAPTERHQGEWTRKVAHAAAEISRALGYSGKR